MCIYIYMYIYIYIYFLSKYFKLNFNFRSPVAYLSDCFMTNSSKLKSVNYGIKLTPQQLLFAIPSIICPKQIA